MARTRIASRKLGTSDGKAFELTAIGVAEQQKNKLRRDHERQHTLITMGNEKIRKENARQAAEKAIDFILNTKKPQPC